MTKQTGKEVAVKQNGFHAPAELMKEVQSMGLGLGAGDSTSSDDIIIPKIHLAQPLSPIVIAKNVAKAGQFVDLNLEAVLPDTLDLIIIDRMELLQVYSLNKKGEKDEWLTTLDYSSNVGVYESKLFEGNEVAVDKVNRFYCLRVDELLDGCAFPWAVDFKRTSAPAGRRLAGMFFRMKQYGVPSYTKVFKLSSQVETKDNHTFYVKKISTERDITKNELAAVAVWVKQLQENRDRYRVDDSKDDEPVTVEAKVVSTQKF